MASIEVTVTVEESDAIYLRQKLGEAELPNGCKAELHMTTGAQLIAQVGERQFVLSPGEFLGGVVAAIAGRRCVDLQEWLNTTCREALNDDERILEAAAMLKVGQDRGDPPMEIIRRAIAGFVRELIEPGAMDQEAEALENRTENPEVAGSSPVGPEVQGVVPLKRLAAIRSDWTMPEPRECRGAEGTAEEHEPTKMEAVAVGDDGWSLGWECPVCGGWQDMIGVWPFNEEFAAGVDLEAAGFRVE